MPKRRTLQQAQERRARLLPEVLAAVRQAGGSGIIDRNWVQLALQYFHDLPARTVKNLQDKQIATDADGITIEVEGQDYWIPQPHVSGLPERY